MQAIWKGSVAFGLVNIPVKAFVATESHDVSFRQVHVADGGRSVIVPRLLLWYLGDFGGRGGIVRLLREHGFVGPEAAPKVTFGDYDWSLAVDAGPVRDVLAHADESEEAEPATG